MIGLSTPGTASASERLPTGSRSLSHTSESSTVDIRSPGVPVGTPGLHSLLGRVEDRRIVRCERIRCLCHCYVHTAQGPVRSASVQSLPAEVFSLLTCRSPRMVDQTIRGGADLSQPARPRGRGAASAEGTFDLSLPRASQRENPPGKFRFPSRDTGIVVPRGLPVNLPMWMMLLS